MKWWQWVILAVLAAAAWVYWKQNQRTTAAIKKIEDMAKAGEEFTEADAKAALQKVAQIHGKQLAAQIEKVARLETAHFKSKQYLLTGTGGMEVHGSAPYYGWFAPFFVKNPSYTPVGTTAILENKGMSTQGGLPQSAKPKEFVIMPSVEAWMMFLADYATRHAANGGIARWYSTDKTQQQMYNQKLAQITPKIVNNIV